MTAPTVRESPQEPSEHPAGGQVTTASTISTASTTIAAAAASALHAIQTHIPHPFSASGPTTSSSPQTPTPTPHTSRTEKSFPSLRIVSLTALRSRPTDGAESSESQSDGEPDGPASYIGSGIRTPEGYFDIPRERYEAGTYGPFPHYNPHSQQQQQHHRHHSQQRTASGSHAGSGNYRVRTSAPPTPGGLSGHHGFFHPSRQHHHHYQSSVSYFHSPDEGHGTYRNPPLAARQQGRLSALTSASARSRSTPSLASLASPRAHSFAPSRLSGAATSRAAWGPDSPTSFSILSPSVIVSPSDEVRDEGGAESSPHNSFDLTLGNAETREPGWIVGTETSVSLGRSALSQHRRQTANPVYQNHYHQQQQQRRHPPYRGSRSGYISPGGPYTSRSRLSGSAPGSRRSSRPGSRVNISTMGAGDRDSDFEVAIARAAVTPQFINLQGRDLQDFRIIQRYQQQQQQHLLSRSSNGHSPVGQKPSAGGNGLSPAGGTDDGRFQDGFEVNRLLHELDIVRQQDREIERLARRQGRSFLGGLIDRVVGLSLYPNEDDDYLDTNESTRADVWRGGAQETEGECKREEAGQDYGFVCPDCSHEAGGLAGEGEKERESEKFAVTRRDSGGHPEGEGAAGRGSGTPITDKRQTRVCSRHNRPVVGVDGSGTSPAVAATVLLAAREASTVFIPASDREIVFRNPPPGYFPAPSLAPTVGYESGGGEVGNVTPNPPASIHRGEVVVGSEVELAPSSASTRPNRWGDAIWFLTLVGRVLL